MKTSDTSDLFEEYNTVDNLIKDGDLESASVKIRALSEDIPDRYNCYKLIKRSINIGELSNNYTLFLDISKAASNKYSGNEDLHAYYVMALLKNKDYNNAYKTANNYLKSEEFKPLLAQATLYFNSRDSKGVISYLDSQREPAFYEYLATTLEDDKLLINAALLWANKGEIEKAYKLIHHLEDEGIQEAIALLAYDSGRESEALVRLLELPFSDSIKNYNMLIIADLFYKKENWSRSRYYYEESLKIDNLNSYAYINISNIFKRNSRIKRASNVLEEGIDIFKNRVYQVDQEITDALENLDAEDDPVKKDLIKRLVDKKNSERRDLKSSYRELVLLYNSLNRDIDSNKALRILKDFRVLYPEDVKVELLLMKSLDGVTSPEIFEAKLWKLLNSEHDKDNREVSEYLIWYYLGIGNYENVELILDRFNNRNPNNSWTNYYKGILSGIYGDYIGALNYLEDDDLTIPQWELLYNRGIIEFAKSNNQDALTLFNKSIISLNSNFLIDNRDIYRSRIKTKIAEVLISLGDLDEAIRVLNQAIELDPSNYRSDLLKSVHLNIRDLE